MTQNLGNLFIDGEDGIIEDETGTHTITLFGDTAVTTNKFCSYGGSTSSIYFDGSGDYLRVPENDNWDFGAGDFTIDMWVQLKSKDTFKRFICQYANSSNYWALYFHKDDGLQFKASSGINYDFCEGSATSWDVDTWYHIAVVREGNNWKLFKDGIVISTTTNITAVPTVIAPLEVGAMTGLSQYFDGYMDNIRLTKGEALWTTDFSVAEKNLFYSKPQANPNRPDNISKLYSLSSRGNLRGKAKEGFIRPTLGQFITSMDFEELTLAKTYIDIASDSFTHTQSKSTGIKLSNKIQDRGWDTGWVSDGIEHWVKIDFETAEKIERLGMENWGSYGGDVMPSNYRLEGSNNDIDWDVVLDATTESLGGLEWRWYYENVTSPDFYRYYKLVVTNGHFRGSGTYWVVLSEWALFKTE